MKKIEDNELFLTTTDTIIGIGGKVNDSVKESIYKLKNRDKSKKLIIVVGTIDQLKSFEILNSTHYAYIKKYWPGNTTLIINDNAYRMPNNKKLLKLISEQGPFYLTSANISNQETINDLERAKLQFPNLRVYNFGCGSNKPSQIINTKNGEKIR